MAIVIVDGREMKRCPKCRATLDIEKFGVSRHSSDGRASSCKECFRAYRIAHYYANPAPYKDRARARRAELRELIRELKDGPCADCGVRYPYYVMQWDHVRGLKVADPSRMTGTNRDRILAEIAKCDLVCANCHAARTFARMGPHLSNELA